MSNYSKLLGSIIGGLIGMGVSKGLLPTEFADPVTVSAITTAIGSLTVFLFPANKV